MKQFDLKFTQTKTLLLNDDYFTQGYKKTNFIYTKLVGYISIIKRGRKEIPPSPKVTMVSSKYTSFNPSVEMESATFNVLRNKYVFIVKTPVSKFRVLY